jgi:hypothetical protein
MDLVKPPEPVDCPFCQEEMIYIGKASVGLTPRTGGICSIPLYPILSVHWDRKDALCVASDLQAVHKILGGRHSNISIADLSDSFLCHLYFENSELVPLTKTTDDILERARSLRYSLDSKSLEVFWQLSTICKVKNWLQFHHEDGKKNYTFFLPIVPDIKFKTFPFPKYDSIADKSRRTDLSRLPIPNFWIRRLLRRSLAVRMWIHKTSLLQSHTKTEGSIRIFNEFTSDQNIEYWLIDNSKDGQARIYFWTLRTNMQRSIQNVRQIDRTQRLPRSLGWLF